MSTEQNKMVIRRLLEEVFNQGKLETADELVAPTYLLQGKPTPPPPGPESMKQSTAAWRRAFPNVHCTVDDILAEGDRVAYRWTIRGTHQGGFMGADGTGQQITISGMAFIRIADGQVVEAWNMPDRLARHQQLGLLPDGKAKE